MKHAIHARCDSCGLEIDVVAHSAYKAEQATKAIAKLTGCTWRRRLDGKGHSWAF